MIDCPKCEKELNIDDVWISEITEEEVLILCRECDNWWTFRR
jgi:hypothetical protein